MQTTAATQPEIIYPETDGEPMAQNTKQAEVMMTLKKTSTPSSPTATMCSSRLTTSGTPFKDTPKSVKPPM